MGELAGQLALVTGATGGIGKATCIKLASLGCDIAVHFHSAKDAADDLVEQLKSSGVKAEVFQADLRDYEQVGMIQPSSTVAMLIYTGQASACTGG
jgi:3-oxoacyl-[acyl-carrier protein] reductase